MDIFVVCVTKKETLSVYNLFLAKLGSEVSKFDKKDLSVCWRGVHFHFVTDEEYYYIVKGRRNCYSIYGLQLEKLLDAIQ